MRIVNEVKGIEVGWVTIIEESLGMINRIFIPFYKILEYLSKYGLF